jgi:hypothetical protein
VEGITLTTVEQVDASDAIVNADWRIVATTER